MVREVNKRRRSKSIRKRSGLLFEEIQAINLIWGDVKHRRNHMVERMIALAMTIAFLILLRFSDLCFIHLHGIFWCPKGVMICMTHRKNNQHGVPSYLPIADTGKIEKGQPCSAVDRLRSMVVALTGEWPPHEGFMTSRRSNRFLFRRIQRMNGYTHASQRVDTVVGSGLRPMGRDAYDGYLSRYRDALVSCCRMSRRAARTFGTQSARSGGNTWLFKNNMSSDLRMSIGEWATPSVERGYLRLKIQQKLELVTAVGL